MNNNNENKVSKLSFVLTIILSVLACFTLFISIQTVTKGYSSIAGYSLFRVASGSMEPTIETGSLLVCKKDNIGNIKTGDIICFRSKSTAMLGAVITHRVVDVIDVEGKKCLETKGDNNNASDSYYVDDNNLIGKVIYYKSVNNASFTLMKVLNSKLGFLALVVIPVLLIGGYVLKKNVDSISLDIKKEKEKYETLIKENEKTNSILNGYKTITQDEYLEIYEKIKKEILYEIEANEKKE